MTRDPVLTVTGRGLYCPAGDFYIDPHRPVARAVVTHGHSDHACRGHRAYLCTPAAAPAIRHRLGRIAVQELAFGTALRIGGAVVSLHPAGHLPGSAQVRVEVGGEVWVVSGDYKTEPDGFCEPFAPVRCHTFITESTFALPVFRWAPEAQVVAQIRDWWQGVAADGGVAVVGAWALGKAQRVLAALGPGGPGPVLAHPAVAAMNAVMRAQGLPLPPAPALAPDAVAPAGALVIAPPNTLGRQWGPGRCEVALASGWMALRATARRRGAGRGFALSDHADWEGLNTAIRATGAERVLVTHGYTAPFSRWLAEQGHDAQVLG